MTGSSVRWRHLKSYYNMWSNSRQLDASREKFLVMHTVSHFENPLHLYIQFLISSAAVIPAVGVIPSNLH